MSSSARACSPRSARSQPDRAQPMTPRLALDGVAKSFGGIRALKGVSFAVRPGSIHAVLGENGAGKSTLVRIVTGIEQADSGEVRLDGEPVRFASPMAARAR